MNSWKPITSVEPADGVVVLTCIDDDKGVRNEAKLVRKGSLWFFDDISMYVYYRPTHYQTLGFNPGDTVYRKEID